MKRKSLLVIPIIIILVVAGFGVYNYYFHVINAAGNGSAYCEAYLRGDCDNSATFDSATGDLTVYGLGQITGQTMYNAAFAYGPAAAKLNSQYGPIGSTFYTSSALSNNVLKSGETITFTFDDINASAPVTDGYNGYLYVAYTSTATGSPCAGPIANLTQCSIFNIATINLK